MMSQGYLDASSQMLEMDAHQRLHQQAIQQNYDFITEGKKQNFDLIKLETRQLMRNSFVSHPHEWKFRANALRCEQEQNKHKLLCRQKRKLYFKNIPEN